MVKFEFITEKYEMTDDQIKQAGEYLKASIDEYCQKSAQDIVEDINQGVKILRKGVGINPYAIDMTSEKG